MSSAVGASPASGDAALRAGAHPRPVVASRRGVAPLGIALIVSFPVSIALLFQWLLLERVAWPFAAGGEAAPLGADPAALPVDLALLAAFALPHSLLLRGAGQRLLCRLFPRPLFYTAYGLVSSLTLIAVTTLWRPIAGELWRLEGPARAAALCGYGLAWAGMAWSLYHYGALKQPGIEQWWAFERGRRLPSTGLPTTGPYRFTRHPIYLSMFFMIWVVPTMTASHLLLSLAWSAYLVLGALHKEVRLRRQLREAWDRYAEAVPALPLARALWRAA